MRAFVAPINCLRPPLSLQAPSRPATASSCRSRPSTGASSGGSWDCSAAPAPGQHSASLSARTASCVETSAIVGGDAHEGAVAAAAAVKRAPGTWAADARLCSQLREALLHEAQVLAEAVERLREALSDEADTHSAAHHPPPTVQDLKATSDALRLVVEQQGEAMQLNGMAGSLTGVGRGPCPAALRTSSAPCESISRQFGSSGSAAASGGRERLPVQRAFGPRGHSQQPPTYTQQQLSASSRSRGGHSSRSAHDAAGQHCVGGTGATTKLPGIHTRSGVSRTSSISGGRKAVSSKPTCMQRVAALPGYGADISTP